MVFGIQAKLEGIESSIRDLQRRMEREELRTKQLLIMFKMILERVHNPHRSKNVKVVEIIDFMDALVKKNFTSEDIREPSDLISEIIKKGIRTP